MHDKQFAGRIKYRGLVDFDGMYRKIHSWLGDGDYTLYDDFYSAKADEFSVKIRGEKRVTGYVVYRIRVEFESNDFRVVEVQEEGKKKRMYSGHLKIDFFGDVETDFDTADDGKTRLWETSQFLERLKYFFEHYVFYWRYAFAHPDTIYDEAKDLIQVVRKFMELRARVERYDELHRVE